MHERKRAMPWRIPEPDGTYNPYKILISEIMLQQTQVNRVIPKYSAFLLVFPDIQALAEARFSDVLSVWSGLGYNRRAKYLHESAKQILATSSGTVPKTLNALTNLQGIGHNTAAAICIYAYNQSHIFVETNIRTVFIHHFFKDKSDITDKSLLPFIEKSLEGMDPRTFYWALMDYGSYLKATEGNVSAKSKHYSKQSKFQGSKRQIRGKILKLLLNGPMQKDAIMFSLDDGRVDEILDQLEQEGFITQNSTSYSLSR